MTNTINPILFHLNFIQVRWYGLLLGLGVVLGILIIVKLFKEKKYSTDLALDLGVWLTIGGLVGARLGEILFYEPSYYLKNPLEIFFINHGGLSSHGMALGLIITLILFFKFKSPLEGGKGGVWKKYLDILAIPIPLVAGFIRLGNFTNSEIVGRATNLPWGIKFPRYELEPILRHPSQIYEALLAFIIFFTLYFLYKKKPALPTFFIANLFILLYFSSRFLIEFVKEYQTLSAGLTMGQWLSLPFILCGVFYFIKKKNL